MPLRAALTLGRADRGAPTRMEVDDGAAREHELDELGLPVTSDDESSAYDGCVALVDLFGRLLHRVLSRAAGLLLQSAADAATASRTKTSTMRSSASCDTDGARR